MPASLLNSGDAQVKEKRTNHFKSTVLEEAKEVAVDNGEQSSLGPK